MNCKKENNIVIELLLNYLKEDEVKEGIKDVVKSLLEIIILELYPYIFYFILILIFHILLTVYIIYIIFKKIEN
tara:strand:+ start:133 stop:354 length:222 start_codon:yes stop_codon:yes gene_type:complete